MTKLTIDMPPPLSRVSTLAPSEQHQKNNGQMMCRRKQVHNRHFLFSSPTLNQLCHYLRKPHKTIFSITDPQISSMTMFFDVLGFHDLRLVFMIFQGIFLIPDKINPTSHKCGEVCYFFVLSHGCLACVPHEQQCFTNQFVHSHLVPQINRVPHQQQCH